MLRVWPNDSVLYNNQPLRSPPSILTMKLNSRRRRWTCSQATICSPSPMLPWDLWLVSTRSKCPSNQVEVVVVVAVMVMVEVPDLSKVVGLPIYPDPAALGPSAISGHLVVLYPDLATEVAHLLLSLYLHLCSLASLALTSSFPSTSSSSSCRWCPWHCQLERQPELVSICLCGTYISLNLIIWP